MIFDYWIPDTLLDAKGANVCLKFCLNERKLLSHFVILGICFLRKSLLDLIFRMYVSVRSKRMKQGKTCRIELSARKLT